MRIGELSKTTGVSVATIRLYEREGLIGPADRTDGKTRVFSEAQKRRLVFIKRVRNLGFSLDDVKALLAFTDSHQQDRVSLVERMRSGIASRKRDLARLEKHLNSALEGSSPADVEDAFPIEP